MASKPTKERKKEEIHPWLGKKVSYTPKGGNVTLVGTVKRVEVSGAVTMLRDNGDLLVVPDSKLELVDS